MGHVKHRDLYALPLTQTDPVLNTPQLHQSLVWSPTSNTAAETWATKTKQWQKGQRCDKTLKLFLHYENSETLKEDSVSLTLTVLTLSLNGATSLSSGTSCQLFISHYLLPRSALCQTLWLHRSNHVDCIDFIDFFFKIICENVFKWRDLFPLCLNTNRKMMNIMCNAINFCNCFKPWQLVNSFYLVLYDILMVIV